MVHLDVAGVSIFDGEEGEELTEGEGLGHVGIVGRGLTSDAQVAVELGLGGRTVFEEGDDLGELVGVDEAVAVVVKHVKNGSQVFGGGVKEGGGVATGAHGGTEGTGGEGGGGVGGGRGVGTGGEVRERDGWEGGGGGGRGHGVGWGVGK